MSTEKPKEDPVLARMAAQSAEFLAAQNLSDALRNLDSVCVVDDNYPAVRHEYEGAVHGLIKALRANGRI